MELHEMFQMVQLTKENMTFFQPFFPQEFLPEMEQEEIYGIGMVYKKIACGVMLVSDEIDSLHLHWIYIAPDYRRRGFASFLMTQVQAQTKVKEIPLRTGMQISSEKEDLLAFLRQSGFQLEADGETSFFTLGQLRASTFLQAHDEKAYTLEEKPDIDFFLHTLEKEGDLLIEQAERKNLWDALSTITIHDGKICSCLLIRSAEENQAEVVFLHLSGRTSTAAALDFMALLNRSMKSAAELGLPDSLELTAHCIAPEVTALMKKLIPDRKEILLYQGVLMPQAE